ncbi:MAG: aldehyde dehydrogenase family protein [Thermoplasmataceae archaeon]
MVEKYGNFINGSFDFDGEQLDLRSPTDGSVIARITIAGREKTEEAIDAAYDAFYRKWVHTSIKERRVLLERLADRIMERSGEYSTLESLNTGKTLRQSTLMDIPLGIEHIRYFANNDDFNQSRRIKHPEYPDTEGEVQYAPMGVVGAIAPWNVPFLMAVWKLAPALLAGNTVVLKPSHFTPLTALQMAADIREAGFPPGVVNVVTGQGSSVGEAMTQSRKVNMISFTGSTITGRKIMRDSSENIKKVTLELGGKSPNIVMDDCDLDHAVKGVMFGIFLNSGQLCESGSRLLVSSKIREKFLQRMRSYLEGMKAGNPMDMETDVSAITTEKQKKKITSLVEKGAADGSKIFYRKNMTSAPESGFYYPPTILTEVPPESEVAREEIFGPVLSVTEFDSDDEAIEIANSSRYGLAAGVWSQNISRARKIGSRLESGTVWVNEYHLLSAAAPRGGFKDSGIGRELGMEGILEYTQTRHLFISKGKTDQDDVAYGLLLGSQ